MKAEKKQPQKTSIIQNIVNTLILKANADCYVTQNENEHMKKGKGSMYAEDISCGGKFPVLSSEYFDKYVIDYIGIDKRLGNYVILKHGEYKFLYGHTESDLNIGDRIGKNVLIGYTNVSGLSTGNHLHFELWSGDNNISLSYLKDGKIINNPKSFNLRMQRGWVKEKEINQLILDFISGFEGCHLESYYDINHYSIGYGTASYKGEKITKDEADKRARKVIQNIREKYGLNEYNLNIQKALVSYIYNIGSLSQKQKWLLKNNYIAALANDMKEHIYAGGEIMGGLVKRRQAEFNLLIN